MASATAAPNISYSTTLPCCTFVPSLTTARAATTASILMKNILFERKNCGSCRSSIIHYMNGPRHNWLAILLSHYLLISRTHLAPIKHFKECLDIIRSQVLILEIIRMLPYIKRNKRNQTCTFRDWVVLVGSL